MTTDMSLSLISEVMAWGPEQDAAEFRWLRLMSAVKYDGYADYRAGTRFTENLATWLKQFDSTDRTVAYNFIKNRLIYISPPEMLQLIEAFLPEVVTPRIRSCASEELGVPDYAVWANRRGDAVFQKMLRKTLFVGISDGSRIDVLRRSNTGRLVTDQVVHSLFIDNKKWESIGRALKKDLGEEQDAKFDQVYMIDDFTASGTTFIRPDGDGWKGKFKKFNDNIREARKDLGDAFPLKSGFTLHVHHYLSSQQAHQKLKERVAEAKERWSEREFQEAYVTEGLCLSSNVKLNQTNDAAMLKICNKYYDHSLFEQYKEHCDVVSQTTMKMGYADCGLPIVLDHNTPNNSIPLLWANTDGTSKNSQKVMRPLFERRSRHG